MGEFRERLNRNEERRRDRLQGQPQGRDGGDGGREGWGQGQGRRDGDREAGGRSVIRDSTGRPLYRGDEPETPGGSSTSAARLRNQGWDSTPARDGGSATPRSRSGGASIINNSWDSTPRAGSSSSSSSSSRRRSEWDTPRTVRVGGDESPGPLPEPPSSALDQVEWEQDARGVDREWYNLDEGGTEVMGDGSFDGYDDYADREAELIAKAGGGAGGAAGGPRKRVTARQAARNAENDQWERNQLALSGVTGERRQLDFDNLDDDEESRVHLLVHDLKPPFLDGRMAFTKQLEPINPIKDPTSDLAVFAKKGSQLVMERRAQREREKVSTGSPQPLSLSFFLCLQGGGGRSLVEIFVTDGGFRRRRRLLLQAAAKAASLAGTALGNIMGVKEEADQQQPSDCESLTH